jgi:hypothetical protein
MNECITKRRPSSGRALLAAISLSILGASVESASTPKPVTHSALVELISYLNPFATRA